MTNCLARGTDSALPEGKGYLPRRIWPNHKPRNTSWTTTVLRSACSDDLARPQASQHFVDDNKRKQRQAQPCSGLPRSNEQLQGQTNRLTHQSGILGKVDATETAWPWHLTVFQGNVQRNPAQPQHKPPQGSPNGRKTAKHSPRPSWLVRDKTCHGTASLSRIQHSSQSEQHILTPEDCSWRATHPHVRMPCVWPRHSGRPPPLYFLHGTSPRLAE
jgi:hypothetical protein